MTPAVSESSTPRREQMIWGEHNWLRWDFSPGLANPRSTFAFTPAPFFPGSFHFPFPPGNSHFESPPHHHCLWNTWAQLGLEALVSPPSVCLQFCFPILSCLTLFRPRLTVDEAICRKRNCLHLVTSSTSQSETVLGKYLFAVSYSTSGSSGTVPTPLLHHFRSVTRTLWISLIVTIRLNPLGAGRMACPVCISPHLLQCSAHGWCSVTNDYQHYHSLVDVWKCQRLKFQLMEWQIDQVFAILLSPKYEMFSPRMGAKPLGWSAATLVPLPPVTAH